MTDIPAGTAVLRAHYTGRARDLFPLHLKALLLTCATLGFYRFWGRTLTRAHVWWRTEVLGDRLEYTGTGRELLVGFLKAVLALLPLFVVGSGLDLFADILGFDGADIAQYVLTAILLHLYYVGVYAGRVYRMGRTRWRGIRFRLLGSPLRYATTAMFGWLLIIATAGFYSPFLSARLARYEIDNLRFGNAAFHFDGKGRDLLGPFVINWFLFIFTLGLIWFWYDAERMRYIAAHTTLGGLRFKLSDRVGAWRLIRLRLGNFVLGPLTLGILYPVVARRTMRFWCDNLAAEGTITFAAIGQADKSSGGEGAAGFFNVDALGG